MPELSLFSSVLARNNIPMKILNKRPPNYAQIAERLTPPKGAVFAHGETIYNPTGEKLPPDIIEHEKVHMRQQEKSSPAIWWTHYLTNLEFRQEQELEAFATQYKFVEGFYPHSARKEALFEFARNLSENYGLHLTFMEAETLIRKRAKILV